MFMLVYEFAAERVFVFKHSQQNFLVFACIHLAFACLNFVALRVLECPVDLRREL